MKFAAAVMALTLSAGAGASEGRASPFPDELAQGRALYEAHCAKCHAIATNEVGPRHRNVVGRRAGSVADFTYSPALRNSKVVWTEDTLDRWLTNPEDVIPGQEMDVRIRSAEDRRLLILYLKAQTAPPSGRGLPP